MFYGKDILINLVLSTLNLFSHNWTLLVYFLHFALVLCALSVWDYMGFSLTWKILSFVDGSDLYYF